MVEVSRVFPRKYSEKEKKRKKRKENKGQT
jgi:hypothetical protein